MPTTYRENLGFLQVEVMKSVHFVQTELQQQKQYHWCSFDNMLAWVDTQYLGVNMKLSEA